MVDIASVVGVVGVGSYWIVNVMLMSLVVGGVVGVLSVRCGRSSIKYQKCGHLY